MLIPDIAYELLLDAGALVVAAGSGAEAATSRQVVSRGPGPQSLTDGRSAVELKLPPLPTLPGGALIKVVVKTYSRSLSQRVLEAAAVHARPGGRLLLIADRLGPGVRETAAALGVSVIGLHGERGDPRGLPIGHLAIGPGQVLALGELSPDEQLAGSPAGKPAWGALTVIRTLLLLGPMTQTRLAEVARVSQPRVWQILASLERDGLVSRNPPRVLDWDRLLDHWLSRYPGPEGVQTHWFGVAPPGQQARAVTRLFREQDSDPHGGEVLVSGDSAADQVTPWGRPGHSVVYTRQGADLHDARLTPCRAQDATLTLVVPRDPGIWTLPDLWWNGLGWRSRFPDIPLADPLQILADLLRSRTMDADQTAAHLRGTLRQQVQTAAGPSDSPGSPSDTVTEP